MTPADLRSYIFIDFLGDGQAIRFSCVTAGRFCFAGAWASFLSLRSPAKPSHRLPQAVAPILVAQKETKKRPPLVRALALTVQAGINDFRSFNLPLKSTFVNRYSSFNLSQHTNTQPKRT